MRIRGSSRWFSAAVIGALLCAAQAPSLAATGSTAGAAAAEDATAREAVARALAAHGLDPQEIDARLAQLSGEDLRYFASHLDQIQAAGKEIPDHVLWIALGALGLLVLLVIF
jgi:hypothetical protein